MSARVVSVTGLLLVCLAAERARAAGVELELQHCPSLTEQTLREHVELELPTLSLEAVQARLVVRCEGENAEIEVDDAEGPYPIRARVELREATRAARERLVALAATELLAQAERARSARRPPPAARAPAARPAPAAEGTVVVDRAPTRPPTPARRVELFAAGSAAFQGAPKTALWGGSLGTLIGFGRRWSLLFDTRFERGKAELDLAEVRWSVLSAFAGGAARVDAGSLRLSAGLGVRAGWLAFAAEAPAPHEGRSLTAPWAGVALPLRFSAPVAERLVPFAGAELGYVFLPVRGDVYAQGALIEQRGAWLSGQLGLGVIL